jgi:uncharacterized protein (DUF924 family)
MNCAAMKPDAFADILDFWFGAADAATRGRPRKLWFEKNDEFDASCRARFDTHVQAAADGGLAGWERTPYAALALVIALDQLPRNMFRGTAAAFAGDGRALAVARRAIGRGFDRLLRPAERGFLYLPFEHAEDLAVQRRSLQLFGPLASDAAGQSSLDYARRHYEIIARFGRFPHRNAILGRPSSAEERAFLEQPGSSF